MTKHGLGYPHNADCCGEGMVTIRQKEKSWLATKRSTPNMTDAVGLVRCNRETCYPTMRAENATATIKICETSPKARIKCAQVVTN